MNPILPLDVFIPDGEAHVMPDGRLYLYGSLDIRDSEEYCCNEYRVFSTDDMVHWTNHGISFHSDSGTLYAPDCAYRDGKYYLYFCQPGGSEGVAVSDTPWGPFTSPKRIDCESGIDPTVFIDDDGQAYYFWGQFSLCGAKLNLDMCTLDKASVTHHVLTEEEHGFHEGASIRKIGSTYYLLYTDITRGRATCLSYATAPAPLGPYKKGGIVIDNTGCDPLSWNDHGSIQCFKGQWYVFYHRSSRNGCCSRRMCAEPITINEDGSIDEVCQSVNGAEPPLSAFNLLEAARASMMRGGAYVCTDEKYKERLTHCSGNAYWNGLIEYRMLDFGSGASEIEIEARGHGLLHVRQTGRDFTCDISVDSEDFTLIKEKCLFMGGIHPLRLFVESEGLDLRSIRFIR